MFCFVFSSVQDFNVVMCSVLISPDLFYKWWLQCLVSVWALSKEDDFMQCADRQHFCLLRFEWKHVAASWWREEMNAAFRWMKSNTSRHREIFHSFCSERLGSDPQVDCGKVVQIHLALRESCECLFLPMQVCLVDQNLSKIPTFK